MNYYQYQEPPDGADHWGTLSVGDANPTTGGNSYEQQACLWNFRPHAPYRCTREGHTDPWHVASTDGRIAAIFCDLPKTDMTSMQRLMHNPAQIDGEK